MKKMNNIFVLLLSLAIGLSLTGCSNKVDELMSSKNYKEAYKIMKENPDKYPNTYDKCRYNLAKESFESKDYGSAYKFLTNNSYKKATKLLKRVKNLYKNQKLLKQINKGYTAMVNSVNSSWKGKNYLNMDGTEIDGKDYYYAMSSLIDSTIKKIDNNEYSLDDNKDIIKNIVGYVPNDLQTLRSDLSSLQKYFTTDKNEYALNSTSNLFIREGKEYAQVYIDSNDCGHFVFNDLYTLVNNEKISSFALCCILGLYKSYGAEITVDNCINVSWNKSTRGYDFCASNDQWSKILNWENNIQFTDEQYLDGSDGVEKYYIQNPNGYNFKLVAIYTIIYDENDNYISTEYSRKENVIGNPIEMEFRIENININTGYKWVTYTYGILNQ